MAYARFADGDVYVYATMVKTHAPGRGFRPAWVCCACRLTNKEDHGGWYGDVLVDSREQMLDHLDEHERHKHTVPAHAKERLQREIEEGDR